MTEDKRPTLELSGEDVETLRKALGLRPLDEIVAVQLVKVRKARQRTPVDVKLIEEVKR